MTKELRYRACPLCEAICGLQLTYDNEQLTHIRGDLADPFSKGHICPKGNAILDLEQDPQRLRRPQLREGDRWREIGWDEALDLAAERLAAVQKAHGDAAIGAYLGNPNVHHLGHIAYLPGLLRLLKSPNIYSASSVDQWPHQLVCALMYGHQFLIPIPDIDHTHFMLMLGANPAASMGSLMTAPGVVKRLKALTARGTLVVIDPRRTPTAELASTHLAITPGTDALLLVALVQSALRLGPPRIDALAGHLQGLDSALAAIAAVDTSSLAQVCGIEPSVMHTLARQLWEAPSACVYGRMGVSTQAFGALCQWLIQILNLITGNLDRVGGVLTNDAVIPLTGPGTSSGRRARWSSRVRGLPEFGGELPVAALTEEISTPGAGQIRALISCAGNPVLSTPDGRSLDAALSGLDFMLSIDIYRNETTRHAHLILPPASFLSQPHYDLTFNALAVRRVARWNAPVQAQQAHERADWQIINGLAERYARATGRTFVATDAPHQLISAGLQRGNSGLDLDTLAAAEHGLDLGPLRPNLLSRLETADRHIHCAPPLLLADLVRLQQRCAETVTPQLRLIGRRDIRSNNSWMHNAPRLIKGPVRHQLHMHPDDITTHGLIDGGQGLLRSRVGQIQVEIAADGGLMRGVVCLPHGFGQQSEGTAQSLASTLKTASYNDLSDPLALDQVSGNAALNGLAVDIVALAAEPACSNSLA
jgi:anaerobic selenocysteine-containing dehydrogenase